VASVSADRYLRIWDMGQVKLVAGARYAHNTPLQCVDYSPETGMLATCSQVRRLAGYAGGAACCAVLCCAVLCCAVLCCAVLCCAVLCCAVLCCAVLCCAVQALSVWTAAALVALLLLLLNPLTECVW
jgi:hypothetical protein